MKIKYLILFLLLYNIGFSQSDNITGRCVGTGDPTVFYPTINQLIECSVFQDTTNGNIYDYKINQWILRSVASTDKYTPVLMNYTELDAYDGQDSVLILNNDVYGGIWIVSSYSGIQFAEDYGVMRTLANGLLYERLEWRKGLELSWWLENGVVDGSVNVTTFIQDALNFSKRGQGLGVTQIYGGGNNHIYLVDELVLDQFDDKTFDGRKCKFLLNHAGNNDYLLKLTASQDFTITNTIFEGTGNTDPTYTANKHRLLLLGSNSSRFIVENCSFIEYTSHAIEITDLEGGIERIGGTVRGCQFYDAPQDNSTYEQCAIYLFEAGEYCTFSENRCISGSFLRSFGGGNCSIINNQFTSIAKNVNFPDSMAVVYINKRPPVSGNNGKFIIMGNHFNHNTGVTQIKLVGDISKPFNSSEIIGNHMLANGGVTQIYVLDQPNMIISGNQLRGQTLSGADPIVVLENSDNAIVTSNTFQGGFAGVNLVNSYNLVWTGNITQQDFNGNGGEVLIDASGGSIRPEWIEFEYIATGLETQTGGNTYLRWNQDLNQIAYSMPFNHGEMRLYLNGVRLTSSDLNAVSYDYIRSLTANTGGRIDFNGLLVANDQLIIEYKPNKAQY